MDQKGSSEARGEAGSDAKEDQSFVEGLWGVRYQVKDVKRSIDFYTKQLGFKLDQQHLPEVRAKGRGDIPVVTRLLANKCHQVKNEKS